ncbi:Na+/H+ antiporter NhaC family protein [Lentibacillus salicampi]|uniref:Na+/H+ antiporter NhaC family protein n=1 Tax=Lentibacillus salicampi TaxID=175306 RepID=A0A4Y9AAJ2_9BACI|nr:Na+/H+ antiporter NhaC family protein [Lentibacillus salicampi]TFJ91920.1 Na+/H+ antiporter NhaC family protein [Lentibacillus salicampi]
MENTIWSLVPPLLAIIMVLVTKRVLLSLGVGIVAAAFFAANFNVPESLGLIWESFIGTFVAEGALNTYNVFILLFVLLLGVITAFVSIIGGTKAFGEWMVRRVKTRAGAQVMTMVFGVIVFIDDYFNSLAVGQVARPVTDKHRISRAKLSYIVDSTAAPVCVVAPVSSWGAYIIGVIGSIFAAGEITEHTAFSAFLQMIPMNLYVWAALGVVLVIALRQVDFGPMKIHEDRAHKTGVLLNPERTEKVDSGSDLPTSDHGKVSDLMTPIAALFVGTIGSMYWTGLGAVEGEHSLIAIFGEAAVAESLLYGGLIGTAVTLILFFRHVSKGHLSGSKLITGGVEGVKSMLPAVFILIFAWAIAFLIEALQTGEYLAGIVESSNLALSLLPVIIFFIAGFIAFATGTSWGSFGILLPIAGQIALGTDVDMLLPILAAVLAGAVFGDHCSPISDSTILSSTGSSCHHIDHVTTQLPYALTAAAIAGLGYVVLGVTGSVWLGLLMVAIGLVVLFSILKKPDAADIRDETVAK